MVEAGGAPDSGQREREVAAQESEEEGEADQSEFGKQVEIDIMRPVEDQPELPSLLGIPGLADGCQAGDVEVSRPDPQQRMLAEDPKGRFPILQVHDIGGGPLRESLRHPSPLGGRYQASGKKEHRRQADRGQGQPSGEEPPLRQPREQPLCGGRAEWRESEVRAGSGEW